MVLFTTTPARLMTPGTGDGEALETLHGAPITFREPGDDVVLLFAFAEDPDFDTALLWASDPISS